MKKHVALFILLLFFFHSPASVLEDRSNTPFNYIDTRYQYNNDFIPDNLPFQVISQDFNIPLNSDNVLFVYPSTAKQYVLSWNKQLGELLDVNIPFVDVETVSDEQLKSNHLVLLGNINDNRLILKLYEQRRAFIDTYFPGENGYIIQPGTSIWNRNFHVLLIGANRAESLNIAFSKFLEELQSNKNSIGAMRLLHTDLSIPSPPGNVEKLLQTTLEQAQFKSAPYGPIADWGLYFHITGNVQWAENFKKACYMLYERARLTGRWISEPWTNVYFNLWKLMLVWDTIDNDPFFSEQDRKIINAVLWGYTNFTNWLPNLDANQAIKGEMQQNHTTFLGLSLYFSYRYYTEKYQLKGLETMIEKVRRCFEEGQENSFVPNDDAGAYLKYAPLHTLIYTLSQSDKSYMENGHLANAADLIGVTFDNFRNQVSFGDVPTYIHDYRPSTDIVFFSMAANFYQNQEYQWMYNWLGGSSQFLIDRIYSGMYPKEMDAVYAKGFTGIKPVVLDSTALVWFGRRIGNLYQNTIYRDDSYFHKMSFRKSFDLNDEYLLLDGVSGLAHGHNDGNTLLRLTWKERIWLFDLDYFKLNTKFHNGVTIVCDGEQLEPPLLTKLDFISDKDHSGISKSTLQNYNGTDWERYILWNKGSWFFVFDKIKALQSGDYRLEGRWRTRGDATLESNTLKVVQGGKSFFIKSADKAYRRLEFEPDRVRSDWKNYPWGNGGLEVLIALEETRLNAGEEYAFANLLTASDRLEDPGHELLKLDNNLYEVLYKNNPVFIGFDLSHLNETGIFADADMFYLDSKELHILNATFFYFENTLFYNTQEYNNLTINLHNGDIRDAGNNSLGKLNQKELEKIKKPFFYEKKYFARKVEPQKSVSASIDFGINCIRKLETETIISGMGANDNHFALGDENGKLSYFVNGELHKEWQTPAKAKITTIALSDLDGDGSQEVIAGDAHANLYCYGRDGELRWSHLLTSCNGTDFSAKDIVVGPIEAEGKPTIIVGTGGWKVYAIRPDGDIRWECLTAYHEITKVGIVQPTDGLFYVLAGTEYQTPLNVIDPKQGKLIYFTWEEMGSEFISETDYFGFHLTDMLSFDANGDGKKDLLFGTLSNDVYALNVSDGHRIWKINAGDEITRLMNFTDPQSGEQRLLVANGYGSLILCDRAGKRLSRIELGHKITDLLVLPESKGRADIIVATAGGIKIVDHLLALRGTISSGNNLYQKLFLLTNSNTDSYRFAAAGKQSVDYFEYHPSFLRNSRQY